MKNQFELFAEITRVDPKERVVEGYAYVNEEVPGEGGLRLTRKAMEDATPDYAAWGTLRSMHQPVPAGVVSDVQWDEKGALIRAKVVGDEQWELVESGVYKGFSVGVRGLAMRGKEVTRAQWVETSLVDRPKDPDARILCYRAEGVEDAAPAVEDTADAPAEEGIAAEPEQAAAEPVAAQEDSVPAPEPEGQEDRADTAVDIQRFEALEADIQRLAAERDDAFSQRDLAVERLGRLQGQFDEVQRALTAAEDRIQTLEKTPRGNAPVRFTHAIERTFIANGGAENTARAVATLRDQKDTLLRSLGAESDPEKRMAGAVKLDVLNQQLRTFGVQ